MKNKKQIFPVILCILDGWGTSKNKYKNAVKEAYTPNIDRLMNEFPNTVISASGLDVGLPKNQAGNSEVGHMAIGSGRIINNHLLRIDNAIKDKSLSLNKSIKIFSKKIIKSGGKVHVLGLVSDGGVHSKDNHILELIKIIRKEGLKVILHVFTDGRDTPPNSSKKYLKAFLTKLPDGVDIGTVMGRFYPMDRDNRWERINLAWKAIVLSNTKYEASNAIEAIENAYKRNETDEFIYPTTIKNNSGEVYAGILNGDGLISANFRSDRMRQILESILDKHFLKFRREKKPNLTACLGMVSYSDKLDNILPRIFPTEVPKKTLSELISKTGLKQLKIAETEKFPHVTFFINGGVEKEYVFEDRILIPSPKVLTYDISPKMSALEIEKQTINSIINKKHHFIVVNFANPDMVGHTGNYNAVKEALEFIDECIEKVVNAVLKVKGVMILTSDHGKCEVMWDNLNESPHTYHTSNKVPFILIGHDKKVNLHSGRLEDIAPTILSLFNIKKPQIMTGKNLII